MAIKSPLKMMSSIYGGLCRPGGHRRWGSKNAASQRIWGSFVGKLRSLANHGRYRAGLRKARTTFIRLYETSPKLDKMSISEYEHIKTIEKGTFGTVKLAKHRSSGEISAIKVVSKALFRKHLTSFIREKRISRSVDHPFISRMHHHFMDGSFVYFAMDYYPAGDLTSYLSEFCKMGIAEIQFFGAQLAMAIQFLHSVGVVHRDIKLENIFIDGDGYIKLGDFGMAKNIGADGRTFSVCGSFNYMAPEMLKIIEDKKKIRQNQPVSKSKGYGVSADWWSYGVLMFILAVGEMPFDKCNWSNYKDIAEANVQYPEDMEQVLVDFLHKLITPDVRMRLGCGRRKGQEVLDHQLFAEIDLPALYLKQVLPPLIPVFMPPEQEVPRGNFDIPISLLQEEFKDF